MNKEEFDRILHLLQNPTRRKIMEVLSKEEHYPLQISKAIDTSQQAISKHLKTMEKNGIVISKSGESEHGGPPTKRYTLNREFSLRIDVGPSIFETEVEEISAEDVEGYEGLEDKVNEVKGTGRLDHCRDLIDELDEEIDEIEKKRLYLVKLKEDLLSQAFNYIYNNFDDYAVRKLLYFVIKTGITDPKRIAKEMKVREDEIEELIEKIDDRIDIW